MKKKSVKSLHRKAWNLAREIIIKRDKGKCVLCKEKGSDVDHLFSRRNKTIFYNISNLSLLCKGCHFSKTYGQGTVSYDLFKLVESREKEKFNYLLKESSNKTIPFRDFNKVWWLDEIIESLQKQLTD